MYNILPQVKALGKKQKLCLYHASAIFTEIKILCSPRYTMHSPLLSRGVMYVGWREGMILRLSTEWGGRNTSHLVSGAPSSLEGTGSWGFPCELFSLGIQLESPSWAGSTLSVGVRWCWPRRPSFLHSSISTKNFLLLLAVYSNCIHIRCFLSV